MVVGSDGESRARCAAQNEAAFDRLPLASDLLIDPRSLEPHAAALALNNQGTILHPQVFCALELEFGLLRVGAGCDLEVIFQLSLISVEQETDSRVNIFVFDARELRHADPPLRGVVAHEIVALSR